MSYRPDCELCEQESTLEPGTFTSHEHDDDAVRNATMAAQGIVNSYEREIRRLTAENEALKTRIRETLRQVIKHGNDITDANPGSFGLAWRGATNTAVACVALALENTHFYWPSDGSIELK